MFTGAVNRKRGFTLLEITLAVAILAMMSLVIYRFVQTNLTALRVTADVNARDESCNGLINLLTAQLRSLTPGQGALVGEPLKLNGRPRDEVTWICGAGPGLLTRYAPGDFTVNLRLRPVAKNSDRMEIGIIRKPRGDPPASHEHESWISLLPDVETLQIRYFDPRLNTWVDKWTDTSTLPWLVRLVVGRRGNRLPWEAIVALRRTPS